MGKNKSGFKAFTMVEIMVSILIITVLMAVAIPGYFKHVEKAQGSKALENLNLIRSAEILYAATFSVYTNDLVFLQTYSTFTTNSGDWVYTVNSPTTTTFTATATRISPNAYNGRIITIDENAVVTVDGVINGIWAQ
ncbi:MAG: type II secretion system GspH family protein [Candidatus Omnitrophica bacterium]|nr:type II secretion system GspH family protein [Candidatus Omnitrophota bacterium]